MVNRRTTGTASVGTNSSVVVMPGRATGTGVISGTGMAVVAMIVVVAVAVAVVVAVAAASKTRGRGREGKLTTRGSQPGWGRWRGALPP